MIESDDEQPRQGIYMADQSPTEYFGRSTASYLTPATGSSAWQSTDDIEHQRPVHPNSFIETNQSSAFEDSGQVSSPKAAYRPYPSDTCNFDFTDDGGPVVSFIRTSGRPYGSNNNHPYQGFGSIEIIPSEELAPREAEAPPEAKPPSAAIDVKGWRRGLLVGSVLGGMFLGFLDTTIVGVALPTIAGDFNEYGLSTWVVTAYLLTYMGKCNHMIDNNMALR